MTKKEYCLSHDHIAYYSGVGGIEIHGVEGDYIIVLEMVFMLRVVCMMN